MKEFLTVWRKDGTLSKIVVGEVLFELAQYLPLGRRVIAITDQTIVDKYPRITELFEHIVIERGEEKKTLATVETIMSQLLELKADRSTFLLGIGGGVVTDITGFVASTFMRGVNFGFIPTTLLAQIDASVGGKNGVNVNGYKNMVGTFNQPDFVLCDIDMLSTLSELEFCSGLAEMVKAAIIDDRRLFAKLETTKQHTLRTNKVELADAIVRAINVKRTIVSADERESGIRRKLNLGHTFGHAIEKCGRGFSHGQAVAIGICMAAQIALKMNLCTEFVKNRIVECIRNLSLPTESNIELEKLIEALSHDKKREGENICFILPIDIGKCVMQKLTIQQIRDYLK